MILIIIGDILYLLNFDVIHIYLSLQSHAIDDGDSSLLANAYDAMHTVDLTRV